MSVVTTGNSILEVLGVVEIAVQDIVAFAQGKQIAVNVDGYSGGVVVLPSGPNATYPAVSGSALNILFFALSEAASFTEGAPIALAVKEGNTWYGISLSKTAGQPAVAA